jgi:F-type H+-transporting ATPase subunit b
MSKYVRPILMLAALVLLALAATAVMAQEATTAPAAGTLPPPTVAAPAAAEGGQAAAPAAEGGAAAGEAGAAAPSVSPLAPLGINSGFLIAQIINFGILFIAARVWGWPWIVNMLDSRAARIEKSLEDAAVAANARRNAEAEAEKIMSGARADVSKAIEEARTRGEEVSRQIEAEARAEAERIRAEARTAAAAERDSQLAALRGQVASIAIAATQRLIGESLDNNRQQALVNDFFSKVPAGARSFSGHVEVVSAMPLSADEQARVRREIGTDDVAFSVDPSILGGLIIRAGDRVVDGSIRSGLNELSGRLA